MTKRPTNWLFHICGTQLWYHKNYVYGNFAMLSKDQHTAQQLEWPRTLEGRLSLSIIVGPQSFGNIQVLCVGWACHSAPEKPCKPHLNKLILMIFLHIRLDGQWRFMGGMRMQYYCIGQETLKAGYEETFSVIWHSVIYNNRRIAERWREGAHRQKDRHY